MKRIQLLVLSTLVALAFASVLSVLSGSTAVAARDYGQPTVGTHIYDRAGVLTPEQIADLEARARVVEQDGAPVVVYLQARSASYDQTYDEARDLMNQWDVQSAPDAHDGLVFFFNLNPSNLHHGQVALFAGAKHYKGGNLPKYELQRIFDIQMKPGLAQGNLAQGIAAGLDAAANSLRNGPAPPPEPSAAQRFAADASRGVLSPLNILAVVIAAAFAWYARKVWSTRPTAGTRIATTTSPPDSTPPAVVGAVVTGRIRDAQIEATVLDLARRGALAIETDPKRKAQVRLLDASVPSGELEQRVWESFEAHADSEGIVSTSNLQRVRAGWAAARAALRQQLDDAGLFDPAAKTRRRPVYVAGIVVLVLAVIAFILVVVGKQPWSIVGVAVLLAASLAGMAAMSAYPDTSPAGAELAAKWRSYVSGIKRSKSDRTLDVNLDLDDAMPFAVATGTASSLKQRIEQASEQGYAPIWLGPALHQDRPTLNAYWCWTAFHTAVMPSSSGGSAGGGAAAGGGGAGGSF